ncbi:MAG: hypothetical protein V2A76_13770 [Planctomycetota bacterium]
MTRHQGTSSNVRAAALPRAVCRWRRAAGALLLLGLLTTGCALSSIEEGSKLLPETVQLLKNGMDKAEVLRLLGPPEEFHRPELLDVIFSDSAPPEMIDPSAAIFNDVFSYRYTHGQVRILTVIVFTWMGVDIKSDDLVVFFDGNDRVKYFSYREDTKR